MASTYGRINRLKGKLWKIINKLTFRILKVHYGVHLHTVGKVQIVYDTVSTKDNRYPKIVLGNNVSINSGINYNPIGCGTCTILRTVDNGKIKIGNNVGMSNVSIVSFDCVEIGDNCLLGGGVRIFDSDFHSLNYDTRMQTPTEGIHSKPVKISEGAFVGANSIILKGVTIGKHSIIGAGAVVRSNVPDGEIWAGNPARYVKKVK